MIPVALLIAATLTTQGRDVTFNYLPAAKVATVHVVGQFNNWDKTTHPLALEKDGKTWRGTFSISPGVYQYLFVENGNKWLPDPKAPKAPDGNGNTNSLLIVEPADFDARPAKIGDGLFTASALLHRPDRRDTVRLTSDQVALYLRTRKGDAKGVTIEYEAGSAAMNRFRSDELYDYWRGEAPMPAKGSFEYFFQIDEGKERFLYSKSGSNVDTLFEQDLSKFPLPNPPFWVQDSVFYQIFPDRFKNGDPKNDPAGVEPWGSKPAPKNWMGGDLRGILDGMPYLKDLGISALYLNPIYVSPSNHGYDIFDYQKVNPNFGTNADLKALVSRSHELGWKVILDGVFNHSGVEFAPFADLRQKGAASIYKDWYYVLKFPIELKDGQQTYRTFAGVTSMPKLRTENPAVQKFINDTGTFWIKEAGIDGWRLDVADEVSHEAWKSFRQAVRKAKPDAYILGEVWGDAHEWLQGDEHDAAMNYRWRKAVLDLLAYRNITPRQFESALLQIRNDYPAAVQTSMFNLLGSHDTERIATIFRGDKARQALAVVLQFTYPGVPSIYYGDEIGLEGGRDPDDRRTMPWDKSKWDMDLLALHKSLIALRKANAPLRRGSYRTLVADDKTGIIAFEREYKGDRAIVILNTSDKKAAFVTVPSAKLLFGRKAKAANGLVQLEPLSFAVVGLSP